jgi:hypothetical protein
MSYPSSPTSTETPPPPQPSLCLLLDDNDKKRRWMAFPPVVTTNAFETGHYGSHTPNKKKKKTRVPPRTAASPRKVKSSISVWTTCASSSSSLSFGSYRAPILKDPSTGSNVCPTAIATTTTTREDDDDDDLFVLVPPSVVIHESDQHHGTLPSYYHHRRHHYPSKKRTKTRSFLRPRPCILESSANHHHENPFQYDLTPGPTSMLVRMMTTGHCRWQEGHVSSSSPLVVTCDQGIVMFAKNPSSSSSASADTILLNVQTAHGSSSLWSWVSDSDAADVMGVHPSCCTTTTTPVHPGVVRLPLPRRASSQPLDPNPFTHTMIPSHLTLPSLLVSCSTSPAEGKNSKLPFLARRRQAV